MQKLAVVYFPKANVEKINFIREKYDPNWHIIPPHITIISPLSEVSENQLTEHIEKVIKDIKSFPVHITGLIKTFDDCLFLLVKEGREKIGDVYNRLYSGILTPYIPKDLPFLPHITIGCFRKKNNLFDKRLYDKACLEAKKMNLDIYSTFDRLSLIKGNGVTPATTIRTITLQK